MGEKVIVKPHVSERLNALIDILYLKEYFSYEISAIEYVMKIEAFVYTIPDQIAYSTADSQYGSWYCRYIPNKHTTRYISFDTDGSTWLVKNIFNNHTKDYPRFIKNQ